MSAKAAGCDNETILKNLIKDFLRGSLKHVAQFQPNDIEIMTWRRQQYFLNATVNSELLRKFPVNNDFCRLFLKKLIESLEPGQEVHDDFYTCLCAVMKDQCDRDNFCYHHYVVGNDLSDVITMKETNNMVINGTTGMRTWEAALMVTDWALNNKNLFSKKKILELGSGVGFTGVSIAKFCEIDSIVLTDCHNDVLKTICENVQINFPGIHKEDTTYKTVFKLEQRILEVMPLDWNCLDFTQELVPDIIIGADIVYDPAIIQPLCNTMKKISEWNNELDIYIANIIRNPDTLNYFLKTLEFMNFKYEMIPLTGCTYLDWDHTIERYLLKINIK